MFESKEVGVCVGDRGGYPRKYYASIQLDLNGGVKMFWPIKGQDTKLGGCILAFSHITFVQGRGLNSESC